MRYAIAAILLLFSVAAFGQLDQFRMVGSGSWSVVDDSTYSATVTFASDLTANSFLPTGVVDSMRVFTQRGQVYTIDSVGAKTFSTAVIYAVEYGGDWGSPSGQVLVYETRGRETVPAIPFATNGATSKLQEAVVTHNAAINNGVSTTQLADSTMAAKTYTNNQVASVAPVKDTIVQASHGFSVGDPIWYSGDYLLSLDTGLTVRVDGVVSAVPDINTFILQRTGRFTLTSHGFTVGIQLYVQPDGSYSAIDTSNSLIYGYSIDANTIEIGVKPDAIRTVANRYNDSLAGRGVATKQAMLDSLSGFQSFADITSIQTADPSVGYTLEDRSTGLKYIVQTDSVSNFTVDDSLVIDLSGKYAVADLSGKRSFKTIDEFKREAPLLKIDNASNKVKIGNVESIVSFSPEITTKGTWNYSDTIVDGLFLDTINVQFEGENIFRSSEYFFSNISTGGSNIITSNGTTVRNYGVSPDEKNNSIAKVGSNNIFLFINKSDFELSTDYVFSIFIKNTSVSVDYGGLGVSMGASSSAVLVDTSNHEWTRYSCVLSGVGTKPDYITLGFGGIPATDTLEIWGWQLEQDNGSGKPSSYKKTQFDISAKSGKMYINRGAALLDNGALRLDWLDRYVYPESRRTEEDISLLRKAVAFCNEGKRCNVIQLGKGSYTINDSLVFTNNVRLKGAVRYDREIGNYDYADKGTEVRVEIPNGNYSSALIFRNASGDEVIGSSGLSDVAVTVYDTINKVIDVRECNGCLFENIEIRNESPGVHNIGLDVNVISGSDQYWNEFRNIHITGSDTALQYSGSTDNQFYGIEIFQPTSVGIHQTGGNKFTGHDIMIQGAPIAILLDEGNFYANEIYTEGSGTGGGSVIKMNGGSFHAVNSTFQVDDALTDTLFNITNGNRFSVNSSSIRTSGAFNFSNIEAIEFNSVESTFALAYIPISENQRKKLRVTNNTKYLGTISYPDLIPVFENNNIRLNSSNIINASVTDTLYFNNTIASVNGENLIIHSDSLNTDTIQVSASTVAEIRRTFQNPFGDSATTVTYVDASLNGASSIAWFSRAISSISVGEEYTFSVYAYNHSSNPFGGDIVQVRPGQSSTNSSTISGYLPSGRWVRLSVTDTLKATFVGNAIDLRLVPVSLTDGDSISFAGMQLERNDKMTTYVSTNGSSVTLSNPTEIIPAGKKKVYNGDVEVTGVLTADPSYFLTTGSVTPTTDLSGQFTITHGLGTTPTHLSVGNLSGTEYNFEYSCGSTSCTVTVYDGTGTDTTVNSTGISISWAAFR